MRRIIACMSLAVCISFSICHAQSPPSLDSITRGTGGSFERINEANGGVNLTIPIVRIKGRGGADFFYTLTYSSKIWQQKEFAAWPANYYQWRPNLPWVTIYPSAAIGSDTNSILIDQCEDNNFNVQDIWAYSENVSYSADAFFRTPAVMFEGAELCNSQWDPQWANYLSGHSANLPSVAYASFPSGSLRFPDGSIPGHDANGNTVTEEAFAGGIRKFKDSLGNYVATVQLTNGMPATLTLQDGRVFTFNWITIYATTNFANPSHVQNCSNCSITVLSSIGLPDGTAWTFEYEPNSYGQLKKVTLPTGGWISYTYQVQANYQTGTDGLVVATRTENAGSGSNVWSYAYNIIRVSGTVTERQVTRTTPLGDTTTTTFKPPAQDVNLQEFFETDAVHRSGASQILITTHNDWVCDSVPSFVDLYYQYAVIRSGIGNCRITDQWTTIHDGAQPLTKKVHYDYDSSLSGTFPSVAYTPNSWYGGVQYSNFLTTRGNVTRVLEYDWGTGGVPGALLRQTETDYLTTNPQNGNIDYTTVAINIVNRPKLVTIKDGSGNVKAKTEFQYDGTTLSQTSGIPQHDYAAYPYTNRTRGNLTKARRWLNTNNSWQETTFTYDDLGNLLSESDPLNHPTTYDYSDRWADSSCQPVANTRAYLTTITNAAGHQVQNSWGACNGVIRKIRDQNDIDAGRAGTVYSYDSLARLDLVSHPDGGSDDYLYPSVNSVRVNTANSQPTPISVTTVTDGFARPTQQQINSAVPYPILQDTYYDALGRIWKTSAPYYSNDPSKGYITRTEYDALGRIKRVTTEADGHYVQNVYSGQWTTTLDEAGKPRWFMHDALGQLRQVNEPDKDNGAWGPGTGYWYDALGNLTQVIQNGSRQRDFSYNSLSQLLSATNPENGTTTYAYNTDGTLNTITDARGITTTIAYDVLHRVLSKAFSNGDPSQYFAYDFYSGIPSANAIGRLVVQWTTSPTTQTRYSYDAMGRTVEATHWGPPSWNGPYSVTAGYNLDGSMAWLKYPDTRKVSYTYDTAARLTNVAMTEFNGPVTSYNYWTVPPTVGGNPGYHPTGVVRYADFANTIRETVNLNSRLQPNQFVVAGPAQYANRIYNYCCDSFNANNGNILSIEDWTPGYHNNGRSQFFEYDWLNRIKQASEGPIGNPNLGRWGQAYNVDAWGNLTQISITKGSSSTLSVSVNGNNRFDGYGYDAAGNMTADLGHTYIWDAESRLKGIDSYATSYSYDSSGMRVRKQTGSNSTDYIYFGSEVVAEKKQNGDWSDYIYAGGQRVAKADSFEDRLHLSGSVTCTPCAQHAWVQISNSPLYGNYQIKTGDKLMFRQVALNGARGGIGIWFQNGSSTPWISKDQYQNYTNSDPVQNYWNQRQVSLNDFVGQVITRIAFGVDAGDIPSGTWHLYFNDVVIVSADGTVTPIYTRQTSLGMLLYSSNNVSNVAWEINHDIFAGGNPLTATQFYHGDHLGSARLMTSTGGWPVWAATFLPYGEEYELQTTVNARMFTGHERDSESGLDNTAFRKFNWRHGRWLTPDLLGGTLENPQSLNRYAYVTNQPLTYIDPIGLFGTEAGGGAEGDPKLCTLDGVDYPCDRARRLVQTGAAKRCPHHQCNEDENQKRINNSFYLKVPSPELVLNCIFGGGCKWDPYSFRWIDDDGGLGLDIFHCEGCSQIWRNAAQVTHPKTVVAWYGLSAAVGGSAALAANASTMQVAVGAGRTPWIHVAYRSGGQWVHATGAEFGAMQVTTRGAAGFARTAWFRFRLPVLNPQRVVPPQGSPAFSCITSACSGFLRGWGW